MNDLICDRCQSPMCAFRHQVRVNLSQRVIQERVCTNCCHIEHESGQAVPVRIYRALGVLNAQHRAHMLDAKWRLVSNSFGTGLRQKTAALIKHDRILRGEQ